MNTSPGEYRIIEDRDPQGEPSLQICQIFRDSKGRIWSFCTLQDNGLRGDTVQDLIEEVFEVVRALSLPILEVDNLPEYGSYCPIDEMTDEDIHLSSLLNRWNSVDLY